MKEIIKSQKKNFLKTTKILRFFSVRNARFLNELNITPNQVTFFRFFVLGIFGAYFFYLGGYLFNIIGLMLLFLNFYFDLVDGDLARNYDKKTKLGGFLEELLDPILLNAVLLAITLNLYKNDNFLTIFGILALFGSIITMKMTLYFKQEYGIDCVESVDYLEQSFQGRRRDIVSRTIKSLIVPQSFFSSLFSTFRFYLIVGVLLDILAIAVAMYAIAINLRWFILSIFLLIYNSESSVKERFHLVQVLSSKNK